jgi:hypothetical protein
MSNKPWMFLLWIATTTLVGAGCVQRTLTVQTDPPGALVYLNDQEVGRTPFTRNFIWYGTYDVEIRKEGYASIKTTAMVWAPWWQWVPFDLLAEPLPLTDHHELNYTLQPPNERDIEPDLMIKRGIALGEELESSRKPPTTKPAAHARRARPATKPAQ